MYHEIYFYLLTFTVCKMFKCVILLKCQAKFCECQNYYTCTLSKGYNAFWYQIIMVKRLNRCSSISCSGNDSKYSK